jgi:hypothetical protein
MLTRCGPAAGDATSVIVVVHRRLSGDHADLGRHNRYGFYDRLRRRNRLGSCGSNRCRFWFGLGFDLDGRGRGLLGSRLLGRRLGCHRWWLGLGGRDGLGGRCLLGRGLLGRLHFLRLHVTGQAITKCATFEPIGLCLDQRAGVRLHANTHCFAQRHHFGVGHSELLGELVHAHVFRQNLFSLSLASAYRSMFRQPLSLSCW